MTLLRFNQIINFTESELDALIVSGISTIQSFLVKEASSISKSTSIDIKKIKANQAKLYECYSTPAVNFSVFWEELAEKRCTFSTGCTNLDEMIDGGIFSGEITSIMGASCSGKTQFVHHMALQVASLGKDVIYIDTDGSFSAGRLAQMYDESYSLMDTETVLEMIRVTQVFGLYELLPLLDKLIDELKKPDGPYNEVGLVILDSYNNPFVDVLDYQSINQNNWNREKKQSFVAIVSALNRALRTIVMTRPDIALITTNLDLKLTERLWNNNCGLILNIEKVESEIREISCVQSERVDQSNPNCRVKIDKSGYNQCE